MSHVQARREMSSTVDVQVPDADGPGVHHYAHVEIDARRKFVFLKVTAGDDGVLGIRLPYESARVFFDTVVQEINVQCAVQDEYGDPKV